MLADETGGEERRRKGCSESRWWCVHPMYIVWPEWKKGAPYFASAFSLLAVCNDVSKEGQRKRAQAVSPVQCRAFHSLSFHDERPCHRFECFARSTNIGSERKKEKEEKEGKR